MIEDSKNEIMQTFQMSDLRLLNHFLGMEIYQDQSGIFVFQCKYAEKFRRIRICRNANQRTLIKEDGTNKIDTTLCTLAEYLLEDIRLPFTSTKDLRRGQGVGVPARFELSGMYMTNERGATGHVVYRSLSISKGLLAIWQDVIDEREPTSSSFGRSFVIMYVHNSEHNTPLNSDHDDDIHDSVTRISKLDIRDQLHLHPNDTTALTVVSIKLKETKNYQVWSCAMLLALEGKNNICFIDGSCKRSNTDEVLETYDKVDGSITFGLHNQINTLKQNGSSIADYYHKLNALWKQYDAMIELPKCVCNASKGFKKHNQLLKLMQFLMGLDDSYMQIRSSILSRETLPDVKSVYATISSEESYRVTVGSIASSSQRNQASAFVSNVPYSQNFQRNNQNFNDGPSRTNNVNNNRQGGGFGLNNNRPSGGSGLVCENCGFNGHTIDRCLKIIGYPADFEKKNSGQNFKKPNVSNNNSIKKSSSSSFSDEQITTLLSLIKDNKIGKNVQANMADTYFNKKANQHMTCTDKELDNVIDIYHLKIKVGHPNGTEAYISKIGNLRLSNGLTLYDVMVIPKYCVTLISVHKLIKENKDIIAFDENRCYFLNQDLNLKNVLGIDEQCEGLYYYNYRGGNEYHTKGRKTKPKTTN
ncbi:ribonuclease H-like domain-containing protein [Tanacetum coccineum]